MKFSSLLTRSKARLGRLSDIERFQDTIFETPLLLIYTRRGSVPHLTKDVFQMVTQEPQILSVSLPNTITMAETAQEFNSLAEFAGMKEYPMLMTVQDPAELSPSGQTTKGSLSVWSKQGRHRVTPEIYMDLVENFKPDIYLALCDGDTDATSLKKRIEKSVKRSRSFLDHCLKRHEKSTVLKNASILGAIEGGYCLKSREKSIQNLLEKPLSGFVIDGLHCNGPDVQKMSFETVHTVVQHSLNLIPEDKLKICMGSWNPSTILNLVQLGIDIFDSSYAYLATENSKALVFLYEDSDAFFVVDQKYADDFTPISKSCKCLTCQNHTRAYIHHLHHTKELLGSVLLMIHNIHHYLEFFKAIRHHLQQDTFMDFQKKINHLFPSQ